jgi:O-antigen/teichoic acid export membrane protein
MSKIGTTDIIGTSSAIVSFAGIFAVAATIGIPSGVLRFLGKSFSEQKLEDAKVFVKASLVLVSIGIVACSAIILIARDWLYDTLRIDLSLMIIAILLIGSSAFSLLFRGIFIASLKTKMLPIISIISTVGRLILAIILVLAGAGTLGLTLGYTFSTILTSILLGIILVMTFKSPKKSNVESNVEISFTYASKNILVASVIFWIPFLISTIDIQLGPIIVFGSEGSNQAGVYFMALMIVTGITSVMYSLVTIAYPALSAMQDARKRFTWQTIRLSAIISLPFSLSLIFYSKDILQLLGRNYAEGSLSLEILLLSMLPTTVLSGINALVYSYGNYRQVLAIGLAMSIPRTLLYFTLVPTYGGTGAAMSYTVGSFIGFAISISIAKKIGMLLFWKDLAFILLIPAGLAFVLDYFQINYIIGIFVTLTLSYVLLLKLRILTRSDIQDMLGILPYRISHPIIILLNTLDKKLKHFL